MIWLGLHNGSYIRACTPNNFGTQKYLGSCIDTVVIEMKYNSVMHRWVFTKHKKCK